MTLTIIDDYKALEEVISKNTAEDILKTLRSFADEIYNKRGTLEDWHNPKYKHKKEIWSLQDNLSNLDKVLLTEKFEPKIKEIYSLITKKEANGFDYSLFYVQFYEMLDHASLYLYGMDRKLRDGVADFGHFCTNLKTLRYLLSVGPRDWTNYKRHEAIFNKEIQKKEIPPEEQH